MMPDEAEIIARSAMKCAGFYEANPGLAGVPATIDLYRTIAALATIVKQQQAKLDHLMPDVGAD